MRHFLPLLIVFLLSASCADDLGRRDIFATTSEQVVISFSVDNVVLSRSGDGSSFDEAAINHAYLLFYPSNKSDFSGSPAAVVKADVPETGTLRFNMPVSLQENTSYKLVAIANADTYSPSGSDFETYLKSKIGAGEITSLSDILLHCSESITSSSVSCLPMKGTVKDNTSFRFSKTGGVVYVNVSLSFRRLVSRIDVSNLAGNFTLEGVALCNWRDAVSIGNPEGRHGDIQGKLSGSENSEGSSSDLTFVAPADGGQSLNGALYCFPSSSDSPAPGDQSTTAIIIKGKYGSEESSYYRVNLGLNDDGGAKLDLNTRYTVSITAVNGKGYDSPEAAYSATSEAQIVTATVEDWDIEGGKYEMDDQGHILGVSKTELKFASDEIQAQDIKVLASKDLVLSATFVPLEGTPSDAFSVSLSSGSPISTVTISPKAPNTEETPHSGHCHISATKNGTECLWFDITLNQLPSADKPYVPVIPDAPVALIPLDNKYIVTINHEEKIIEINGFAPDRINSFFDIPLMIYVRDSVPSTNSVSVFNSSTSSSNVLNWPLEGTLSTTTSENYYYCPESFSTGAVWNESTHEKTVLQTQATFTCHNRDKLYLTIGAMGPDDPEIVREIRLYNFPGYSNNQDAVIYTIKIKPRDVIVDDVILTDSDNHSWLVFDRNVQDLSPNQSYYSYTGRKDDDGQKWQAYNYSSIGTAMVIPFKFADSASTSTFSEAQHTLYKGVSVTYGNNIVESTVSSNASSWLDNYMYKSSVSDETKTSPFYEVKDKDKWIVPNMQVLELCRSKMTASKMRMFLVSDVPAKNGTKKIPVCCYWPFHGNLTFTIDRKEVNKTGYYASNTDTPLAIIYCDKTDVKKFIPNPATGYSGLTRLVRSLTPEELTNYKNNFLGYDPSKTCLLKPCHPDTYSSTYQGWAL